MTSSHDVAIVYLARNAEGTAPLRRFANSYRVHEPGRPHELVVVFKGYEDNEDFAEACAAFDGLDYSPVRMTDEGFDIGVYLSTASLLKNNYVCFLNTFSEIACSGWLAALYRHGAQPGVGIAGAMGSYESLHDSLAFTGKAVWLCAIKGAPYDEDMQRYFAWILDKHAPGWKPSNSHRRSWRDSLRDIRRRWRRFNYDAEYPEYWASVTAPGGPLEFCREWPRFPNPHIRSNCFFINRELLLSLGFALNPTKEDSYRFESGVNNLTSRIRRLGLSAVVVGRNGKRYDVPEWPASTTFRLESQENLLVTDNQVRSFAEMSAEERCSHALMTWGDYVKPQPATLPTLGFHFAKGDLSPR